MNVKLINRLPLHDAQIRSVLTTKGETGFRCVFRLAFHKDEVRTVRAQLGGDGLDVSLVHEGCEEIDLRMVAGICRDYVVLDWKITKNNNGAEAHFTFSGDGSLRILCQDVHVEGMSESDEGEAIE